GEGSRVSDGVRVKFLLSLLWSGSAAVGTVRRWSEWFGGGRNGSADGRSGSAVVGTIRRTVGTIRRWYGRFGGRGRGYFGRRDDFTGKIA
ncbi:MAG TPA: hypothetical protein P5526_17080, partial [Anaerolineae bacterium]|nr:hypothetical protein [Anaerolineae bacterium]